MRSIHFIGLTMALVMALCASAFAANYYVVEKSSGNYAIIEIESEKQKGEAEIVKGPFKSEEQAQKAMKEMEGDKAGADRMGKKEGERGQKTKIKAVNMHKMGAIRSSKIVGLEVKNMNNEEIGSIEDLVIAGGGNVGYIILSHGGFLGIGDKLLPIPWDSVKYDPQNEVAVVAIDKKILEKAPSFASNEWPDLSETGWRTKLEGYYEDAKAEMGMDK